MKSLNIKVIATIILLAHFTSCKKEQKVSNKVDKPTVSFETYLQSITLNSNNSELGYIDFSNIGISDGVTSSSYSHFYGALFTSPLDSVGGYLNVGTVTITNSNGSFFKMHSNTPPYLQTNILGKNAMFGSSATVFFPGDLNQNIDTLQESFYLPLPVSITCNSNQNLNPNNSYQINWNQDINNQNGVIVAIYYSKLLNQTFNSSMPATDKLWTQSLSDNGTYQIPATVLSDFPTGSYIDIYVGRAAATPVQIGTGKSINLFSSSYCKLQRKLN